MKVIKDRELKIIKKKEIKESLFKPIIVSIDDMDRTEQKQMKKKYLLNAWWDWLINYISNSIKKLLAVLTIKL